MKNETNLSRLLEFSGKYKNLTYASWILSGLSAIVALLPFICIWKIVDELLSVSPNFEDAMNIAHYGWMAVGFAILSLLIYIAGLLCSHLSAFRVQYNLRVEMMEHISKLPMGEINAYGSGALRKVVDETSAQTETYLAHNLPDTAGAIATMMGIFVMIFYIDWRLGILSLIPLFFAMVCIYSMMSKNLKNDMNNYQDALSDMSNDAVEYVRCIPVVKIFGQTVHSFVKFKKSLEKYEEWVVKYCDRTSRPMIGFFVCINSIFALLVAGSFVFASDGVTTEFILDLMFYIVVTPVLTINFSRIMYLSENNLIIADAVSRIDGVFNMQPYPEPAEPKNPTNNSVEFKDVTYHYPKADSDALKDIVIKVGCGEHIALVGPSGSGKSTIANLIARFLDVCSGNVMIGGVDVRDMPKQELMNNVSYVFQNSKLIKGSIFENVRMGKKDATREEVIEALHRAQCDDILKELPDGIDAVIGSKGTHLSGGQMQRIAIARVMIKNAPILILDEATAFADPDNEQRMLAAFAEASKGRTVISIAHRLTTVKDCDCIYFVKDGRITEYGTHKELVSKGGMYSMMWNEYMALAEWKIRREGVSNV